MKDILQVYGLNLLLIPVHLSGAIASLRQAATGRPVPFQRTPKVEGRTSAPASILAAIWLAPLILSIGTVSDLLSGAELRAMLSAGNALLLATAALYFIGAKESVADFRRHWPELPARQRIRRVGSGG